MPAAERGYGDSNMSKEVSSEARRTPQCTLFVYAFVVVLVMLVITLIMSGRVISSQRTELAETKEKYLTVLTKYAAYDFFLRSEMPGLAEQIKESVRVTCQPDASECQAEFVDP